MKRIILITVLLLACFRCQAQQMVVPPHFLVRMDPHPIVLDQKVWTDGPLEWTDFTFIQQHDGDSISYVNLGWNYKDVVVEKGRNRYVYTDVHATAYKDFSWVDAARATDDELENNQTLFNIAESIARDFRDSLVFSKSAKKDLERYYSGQLDSARSVFRPSMAVNKELENDEFDITRGWTSKDKALFWGFSAATSIPFGSITQITSPSLLIPAEVGCLFNGDRNALILQPYCGLSFTDGKWLQVNGVISRKAIVNLGVIGYVGQSLYKSDRIAIMALGGVGYESLRYVNFTLRGIALSEGVSVDFKSKNWFIFTKNTPTQTGTSVSVKLYVNEVYNVKQAFFTPCLNLSVGIRLYDRKIEKL